MKTEEPAWESHPWLLSRYWFFAAAILAAAVPLVAYAGHAIDWIALGVFSGIGVASWLVARQWQLHAVRLHLAALVVFWGWYAGVAGGLPGRLDPGVAALVVLLVLPLLVSISIDGWRGAVGMGVIAGATLFWRFGLSIASVEGVFLVGSTMVVGSTFHRQSLHLVQSNRRLERIATHDPVSELPNRRALDGRLAGVAAEQGALFIVALTRFKTVNEVFGHATGDKLLRLVGQRIERMSNRVDGAKAFVAHLGGDEFAVLLEHATPASASAVAKELVNAVEQPFDVPPHAIHVSCRLGMATWPVDGASVATLFSRADRAAARAARQADRIALYDATVDGDLDRSIEVELWDGLEQGELFPYFQPVCDLASGEMVGVEALVRWRHKERGILGPASFVEIAEVTGQIAHIDRLMLRKVADQLEEWHNAGFNLWAAVNVSTHTLDDEAFVEFVRSVVSSRPCLRGKLVLEITESAAMRDPERVIGLLHRIRALGVQTALDDFGMGHSSLAYLKRLPAEHLKLDRMFVGGIGTSDRDEALLELLLRLAAEFGMHVIAEGIETKSQLKWLTDRGCRYAQGFLLAHPAPASEMRALQQRVSGVFAIGGIAELERETAEE